MAFYWYLSDSVLMMRMGLWIILEGDYRYKVSHSSHRMKDIYYCHVF